MLDLMGWNEEEIKRHNEIRFQKSLKAYLKCCYQAIARQWPDAADEQSAKNIGTTFMIGTNDHEEEATNNMVMLEYQLENAQWLITTSYGMEKYSFHLNLPIGVPTPAEFLKALYDDPAIQSYEWVTGEYKEPSVGFTPKGELRFYTFKGVYFPIKRFWVGSETYQDALDATVRVAMGQYR